MKVSALTAFFIGAIISSSLYLFWLRVLIPIYLGFLVFLVTLYILLESIRRNQIKKEDNQDATENAVH